MTRRINSATVILDETRTESGLIVQTYAKYLSFETSYHTQTYREDPITGERRVMVDEGGYMRRYKTYTEHAAREAHKTAVANA